MKNIPETRESLLLQIRSPENRLAWEEFVELYQPVVYELAASRGLQHADALDLVQTVFIAVANSISRWEKQSENIRFRNWLLRIAKNATINALTRRPKDQAIGGEGGPLDWIDQNITNSPSERELELEYKRQVYRYAAEMVRSKVTDSNWMAFEMTAIKGITVEDVARELGKSPGAIYAVRSRIMKQLTEIVSNLEESYQ